MGWFATTPEGIGWVGESSSPAMPEALPEDLAVKVKAEMRPGERLLWASYATQRPVPIGPGPVAAIRWLVAVWGLALAGLGYSLGDFGSPWNIAVPFVRLVAGFAGVLGAIIAIGIAITLANNATLRRRSRSFIYALTDARAILWKPRAGTRAVEVYSVPARSLFRVYRVELPDGSGDVIFDYDGSGAWNTDGFLGVSEVSRIEALARTVLIDPNPNPVRRRRAELDEFS